MAIVNFSKAFDAVFHSKLLYKLNLYSIRNSTVESIATWLTGKTQKVVLNGESSSEVRVKLGVPQGTLLYPLLFTIFVSDITEQTKSQVRLFADDCILYRTINAVSDSVTLQTNLNRLYKWASIWQMQFHEKKCDILPSFEQK